MNIIGEIVSGSGTSWKLANVPLPNTLALYAAVRLVQGVGNDYTVDAAGNITTATSYPAGSLTADYQDSSTIQTVYGTDVLSPYALTTLQRVKDILFDPNKTTTLTGASLANGSASVTGVTLPTGGRILVGQVIVGTGIPAGTTIAAIISATQITLSANATQTNTAQTLYVLDQPVAYDGVLVRYINAVTNYLNNECGRRSFVKKSYVHDNYTIGARGQGELRLRDYPVFPVSEADPYHITSFQWRAGTPSNPSWIDFIPDQYELENIQTDPASGTTFCPSGVLRVYGALPSIYSNTIRASYDAGYPVNWANAEDHSTHWLPADITNCCENIVVRRFKRRLNAGKSSEALEGATTSWSKDIDAEDQDTIAQYRDIKW